MASRQDLGDQLILAKSVSGHTHSGWFCCLEQKKELAKRIQANECVVVRSHDDLHGNDLSWCLTHNQEDNVGHAYATGNVSTLD